MKKYTLSFTRQITILFFVLLANAAFSQGGPPDPPPDPGNGGTTGNPDIPIGGNTPIDGGFSILMLLGSAYGTYKYKKRD